MYTLQDLHKDLEDMNVLLARKDVPMVTTVPLGDGVTRLKAGRERIVDGTPIECWCAAIKYVRDRPMLQPYSVMHVNDDQDPPVIAIERVQATSPDHAIGLATDDVKRACRQVDVVLVDPIVFEGHLNAVNGD